MRPKCKKCVLKHLAQAEILWHESLLGYPIHKYYALGHLAEAEAEIMAESVELAIQIRQVRKDLEEGLARNLAIHDLIVAVVASEIPF